jgi:hypothetical protein
VWLEMTTMPSNLKKLVRDRRKKTGESYQQALRQVRGHVKASLSAEADEQPSTHGARVTILRRLEGGDSRDRTRVLTVIEQEPVVVVRLLSPKEIIP